MTKIRITYIVDSDDMSDDEFDNQEEQYFTVNESMIKDLIMKGMSGNDSTRKNVFLFFDKIEQNLK